MIYQHPSNGHKVVTARNNELQRKTLETLRYIPLPSPPRTQKQIQQWNKRKLLGDLSMVAAKLNILVYNKPAIILRKSSSIFISYN